MATDDPTSLLTAFLAERDVLCPRCRYNLRSLTGDRCPECGDQLLLQVGLVEPRLGPYLALVVAAALGFGGSALMALAALAGAPSSWWREADGIWLLVQLGLFTVLLPMCLLLRLPFRRLAWHTQTGLSIVLWLVLGSMCAIFIALFD